MLMLALTPRPESRGVSGPVEVWHVRGAAQGVPAVDGDTSYFLSRTNEVIAIGRQSGRVRWRSPLSPDPTLPPGSRVMAAGPVVVAGNHSLIAFDRKTGRKRWAFVREDAYGFGFYLGPASKHMLFAGSATGDLWALDVATGVPAWRARLGSARATITAPVIDGEDVIVAFREVQTAGDHGVVLVDRTTGATRWRRSVPAIDPSRASPAIAGGPVLTDWQVVVSTHDGQVVALRRSDGTVQWTWRDRDTGAPALDFRPVAIAGRTVVAGSLTGQVVGLDAATGQERWRSAPNDASVSFSLAATSETAFVPYVSGTLVALSAVTGQEQWRIGRSADGFRWPPAVAGGNIYVAGATAGFVALREDRSRTRR